MKISKDSITSQPKEFSKLSQVLLRRYHQETLGTLYLARYEKIEHARIWVSEFISELSPHKICPDILKLQLDKKNSIENYTLENKEIKELFLFLNFRPEFLNKRIIFLFDAEKLGHVVSHKLLKPLEELESHLTLFLLVPTNEHLLPTLESRSIQIQVPRFESEISSTHIETPTPSFKIKNIEELEQYLRLNNENSLDDDREKLFLEAALKQKCKNITYLNCCEELENLKRHSLSRTFHSSLYSRLAPFLS